MEENTLLLNNSDVKLENLKILEDNQNELSDIIEGPTSNDLLKNSIVNEQVAELEEELNIEPSTDTIPNSLALTVREESKLITIKNVLNKTKRFSWKVALSVIVLNFLNMFL